jgi:endonuclease/exonuclease/phosphatase family metal-dependent hydrolase
MRGIAALALTALVAALAGAAAAAPPAELALATWNMQWLMAPATFDELAPDCLPEGSERPRGFERRLPCNAVPGMRWSDADLERLARYAGALDADLVALQEVDGARVAARVFRNHNFCFTRRSALQNVGFAIRKGIPFRCNEDYRALGLPENLVRWGVDVTLFPGTRDEIRLLGVHLKSGCNRDPLTRRNEACETLQRQVPLLERWIDARARQGLRFAVLGDFNRRFDVESPPARTREGQAIALWPEIDDGEPPESDLVDAGAGSPAVACVRGAPTWQPIDHIILSRRLGAAMVPGSYRVSTYPDEDAGLRLSDHCPRSVRLRLAPAH